MNNFNPNPPRNIFAPKKRLLEQEHDQPMVDVPNQTEAAVRQIQDGPPLDGSESASDQPMRGQRSDPAPSAPAIAEERAQQLITNISSQMLNELRSLREQIDDLMRDTNERRDMIREAIRAHAEFAETAVQHKIVIGESVAKLRAEFDGSRTPLPPIRNI